MPQRLHALSQDGEVAGDGLHSTPGGYNRLDSAHRLCRLHKPKHKHKHKHKHKPKLTPKLTPKPTLKARRREREARSLKPKPHAPRPKRAPLRPDPECLSDCACHPACRLPSNPGEAGAVGWAHRSGCN